MNNMSNKPAKPYFVHMTRGYTLIEVMVSMAIMTIGILGLSFLQNLSVQFGQDSYSRTQILFSTNQFIDNIRSLQISPDDGSGNHSVYTSVPGPNPTCLSNSSTAQNTVNCFFQEIARTLPYGTANIVLDGNKYLITVYWSDRGLVREKNEVLDQAECSDSSEVGLNRRWSSTLSWPYGNSPQKHLCMVSRSWAVEVFNAGALGFGV